MGVGALLMQHSKPKAAFHKSMSGETSTVLGTFATVESVAVGFRQGFRFLSLVVLGLGLTIALLLSRATRDLRAPPGAGCS
jgi:hypothetical protein